MKCILTNKQMYMRFLFLLITMLLYRGLAFSQTNDLSQGEMDSFKARCIEYMNAFQKGLEIIADKDKSEIVKQHQVSVLLTFFMGKGEPYVDVNGKRYPAVEMEVSTVNYGKVVEKKSMPIKQYFENLKALQYVSVKITQAKTCVISNLYKTSDNRYQATVSYFQYFEGKRADKTFYRDRTQKDVKVYLTKVTDGDLGTFWDLKFGDINVVETVRLF